MERVMSCRLPIASLALQISSRMPHVLLGVSHHVRKHTHAFSRTSSERSRPQKRLPGANRPCPVCDDTSLGYDAAVAACRPFPRTRKKARCPNVPAHPYRCETHPRPKSPRLRKHALSFLYRNASKACNEKQKRKEEKTLLSPCARHGQAAAPSRAGVLR